VTAPVEPAAVTTVASPTVKVGLRQHKWGVFRLLSPILLLALWQLGSAIGLISQDVLPAPSLIVEAGIELIENGQLVDALRVSGVRVVEGLILGGLIGVVLGTAVGLSRCSRRPWTRRCRWSAHCRTSA
jgi:sulfonate transport system permease protein